MGDRDAMSANAAPDVAATPEAGPAPGAASTPAAGPRLRPGIRVALLGVVGAVLTALALTLLGNISGGAAARRQPLAKGFSLPALGHPGQRVSLSAYAGKPVIVNFFASWCPPCQGETPTIARFYRSGQGRVTILGIDVNDTSSAALAFVRSKGVTYPVGVDAPTAPTASAYGVTGLPQTFFLDAQHRIVKHVIGPVTLRELQNGTAMIVSRTK